MSSNNTNKLSPQELERHLHRTVFVQIIQINLVLKNLQKLYTLDRAVQIIQINLVLKNCLSNSLLDSSVQIIQINLVLKNPVSDPIIDS